MPLLLKTLLTLAFVSGEKRLVARGAKSFQSPSFHALPTAMDGTRARIAILYPGDSEARARSDPREGRFFNLFEAFAQQGVAAEPAIYNDECVDEVAEQLLKVQGVLVWHNPIEGGRDRSVLDNMLRKVAKSGVAVNTHPDTIRKLGTKDILLSVRDTPFGSDAHRIDSLAALEEQLPALVAAGPRVLKQLRGHSGIGIWRIEKQPDTTNRYELRHAVRGSPTEVVDLAGAVDRLSPYFANGGYMISQAWQPRMVEGMTRAYLVRDRVVGFGHQPIVALHPFAADGSEVPPAPRLYSDPTDERFQDLKQRLESSWVSLLCERVGLRPDDLPLLWDTDFLLGERAAEGGHGVTEQGERYVLCEINVSSVSPFPESGIAPLVEAACAAIQRGPAGR